MKAGMLSIVATTLVVGACATSQQHIGSALDFDTDVTITFDIGNDINPDEKYAPSPLYVRFYELDSADSFLRAEFIDLFQADTEILGTDFLGRRDLPALIPGVSRTDRFVVEPAVKYIGIFAEFYQYSDAKFKAVFPVTAHNIVNDSVEIDVFGTSLTIAVEP